QGFGADQSLDRGEAERSKRDALRLKDRRLQVGKGGEADIKISRDNQELLELVGHSLADGRFFRAALHCPLQWPLIMPSAFAAFAKDATSPAEYGLPCRGRH